jgi:hypothetical protein
MGVIEVVHDPDGDFLSYDRLEQARIDAGLRDAITDWLVQRLVRPD